MSKKILILFISFAIAFSSCNTKTSKSDPETNQNATMVTQNEPQKTPDNKSDDKVDEENKETKENTVDDKKINTTDTSPNEDTYSEDESSNISNKEKDWGIKPSSNGVPPEVSSETQKMFEKYSCYYLGDTKSKVIYLTFDEGYENGYTPKILDILKSNDVKAAFFVVKPYITSNKDIVKRMADEGHLVCNHSWHHPSMPSKASNVEKFTIEFEETAKAFKEVTEKDMPMYFRPPMGKYSEKSLYLTNKLGYKSIFWSLAHADWDIKKQPSVDKAHDIVMKRAHNGAIILLHAVSKSNTEALDSIIKDLKSQGYRFGTLDELK